MRIGELARRTGVSPDLLRAWERRYRVLHPSRSQGGFRLYSDADEVRIRAMRGLIDRGLSAAEAARLASDGGSYGAAAPVTRASSLLDALLDYDDVGANASLDHLLAQFSVEAVLREAVFPALRELGLRWERGETTIAQEHFASSLLRGRLLGLARGWGRGQGPRALLACPSGELHDLGLIALGLALREHGWRITFLGADTPAATIVEAAERLAPAAAVVAGMRPERLAACADELSALARGARLALAGLGASAELGIRTGALLLREDPFSAAERIATSLAA